MKKITLGVSLYPEQERLEDIDAYLKLASQYGFTKVFTSMFSVDGTREEIIKYFKDFCEIAHKYGMKVSGDCNDVFIEKIGANENDLSVFVEMGIDIIRMDFFYMDERDAKLINNKEGILIEMSTGFKDVIEGAIRNGANKDNISTCHNFYPQRYSAPSLDAINDLNEYWKERGIPVAMFISSQQKGTHGPWPVSDGLPTIEEHRDLPIEAQLKHCLSLKNVDEIIIGNAYASKEEFEAIDQVMKKVYYYQEKLNIPYGEQLPHGHIRRMPFKVHLEEGVTDLEKEIMMNFPIHNDSGDCLNYMLRSRFSRVLYKGKPIPARVCHKTHFTRGDVVIVNDNLAHYRAEVQIVLKDMVVDGQRNLLGRIDDSEMMILDHLGANDVFTFYE